MPEFWLLYGRRRLERSSIIQLSESISRLRGSTLRDNDDNNANEEPAPRIFKHSLLRDAMNLLAPHSYRRELEEYRMRVKETADARSNRNAAESRLCQLPSELLLIIANFLDKDEADALSLAASCRHLQSELWEELKKGLYKTSRREDLSTRLMKDDFPQLAACEDFGCLVFQRRRGLLGRERQILCSACHAPHPSKLFTPGAINKSAVTRKCRASTGRVRLCDHRTVSIEELRDLVGTAWPTRLFGNVKELKSKEQQCFCRSLVVSLILPSYVVHTFRIGRAPNAKDRLTRSTSELRFRFKASAGQWNLEIDTSTPLLWPERWKRPSWLEQRTKSHSTRELNERAEEAIRSELVWLDAYICPHFRSSHPSVAQKLLSDRRRTWQADLIERKSWARTHNNVIPASPALPACPLLQASCSKKHCATNVYLGCYEVGSSPSLRVKRDLGNFFELHSKKLLAQIDDDLRIAN